MNTKPSFFNVIAIALVAAVLALPVWAHDGKHPDAPNPSPNAVVSQVVGYGNVTVAHGRPGVKGREGEVWGKLVPLNDGDDVKMWMGGANGSTIITFDEKVKIDGQDLAAGKYGMFMVPAEKEWTIIFSNSNGRFGIRKHKPEDAALSITVTPEEAPYKEWLAYEFEKTGELSATLTLHWENLKVGFTIDAIDHRTEKHE